VTALSIAIALIMDDERRILITQRSQQGSSPGKWEFPGGQLEKGELPSDALRREIKEEVDLDIITFEYLGDIHHSNDQQKLTFFIYHVTCYQGEAVCKENQMDLRWVDIRSLDNYSFPAANAEIILLMKKRVVVD
jgi:8-oxo-dGTP diphosphatase